MALMPLSYPYYYQHQLLQENENSISINKVYFLVSKTEFLFHWFKGVMYPVPKEWTAASLRKENKTTTSN